jgi:hypothetical protein
MNFVLKKKKRSLGLVITEKPYKEGRTWVAF